MTEHTLNVIMQGNMNCKCLTTTTLPPSLLPLPPPNVLPLMLQNKIIMTILNRNQVHGMQQNILELGLCEMAKCRGFTSKASSVML